MALRDLPKDERPREKLLAKGAASLADAELVAIFLRTGVKGKSALDLSRLLLKNFGSLGGIAAAEMAEFTAIDGLGEAKFVQLQAAVELARRALTQEMRGSDNLSSPEAVRRYLRLLLEHRPVEVFTGLFLDAQNRLIAAQELFSGTLTQTSVYPREVVRHALRHNAASVIFAHNHPSGVAEPSRADESLTQALKQALALVDVRVLDHFVVGHGGMLSFAERGRGLI
jgi:DNA repair protein RadC